VPPPRLRDVLLKKLTHGGGQIKRSQKTTDKEPARRRLEDLRQNVAKLNTKEGTQKKAVKPSWAY
jgi:hypothetical protein